MSLQLWVRQTIATILTDGRSIAEQENFNSIRFEHGIAGVATETIDMPSISSKLECCALWQDFTTALARVRCIA
jgi:hypothetical protein